MNHVIGSFKKCGLSEGRTLEDALGAFGEVSLVKGQTASSASQPVEPSKRRVKKPACLAMLALTWATPVICSPGATLSITEPFFTSVFQADNRFRIPGRIVAGATLTYRTKDDRLDLTATVNKPIPEHLLREHFADRIGQCGGVQLYVRCRPVLFAYHVVPAVTADGGCDGSVPESPADFGRALLHSTIRLPTPAVVELGGLLKMRLFCSEALLTGRSNCGD